MCEYALINLNMIEYAGYLKKQSAEYARILNVSDAGFVELGHFDKHFVKNTKKEAPQRNILEIFLLDTLKTTF